MAKLADEPENPLHKLSAEQLEAIGREFDELHEYVKEDLGERDAKYIRSIIELHRRLGLIGRAELLASTFWPAWILGTATLSVAKILENMEIGHNVLHGQWDWMNDPVINSQAWDWDTASTAAAWKHSHNYVHHTYTNIRGKDKDLGYEIMRIDPHQPWHPVYLLQPFYNVLLMMLFEWGVAFHDLDLDAVRSGEKSQKDVLYELKGIWGKAWRQILKDYIAWPLMSAGASAAVAYAVGPPKVSRWDRLRRRGPSRAQHALSVARARLQPRRGRGRRRQRDPQPVVVLDHLLRALPRPDVHLQPGGDRERDDRRALRAPADRRGQHRGRPVLPRHERQPRLPGRAPPLPGHAEHALRRDRAEGARDLRALRPALQHRAAGQAARDGAPHDHPARLPRRARSGRSRARTAARRCARRASARPRSRRDVSDLSGEASIEIAAPLERCFAIAADIERAPEWQGAMRSARALQRGAGGPAGARGDRDRRAGRQVTLLLRFDYDEPHGLSWAPRGRRPQGAGRLLALRARRGGGTLATYALDIRLNRALALLRKGVRGPAEARVRTLLVDRPLEGLKLMAEST